MNFFTRELIEMGRSKDHAILNREEELWDEACERYFSQLEALESAMPPGLKQLVDNYYLHDAVVQSMGLKGGTFLIVIQLDTPPRPLLAFTYSLIEEPIIDREALPAHLRSRGEIVEWQYDEIERGAGEPPAWRQSILLSNGWEVELHFRDVAVMEMSSLLPPVGIGTVSAMASS